MYWLYSCLNKDTVLVIKEGRAVKEKINKKYWKKILNMMIDRHKGWLEEDIREHYICQLDITRTEVGNEMTLFEN